MVDQCTLAQRDRESGYCPEQLDPARVVLGAQQRGWLFKNLGGSYASWNVLANQVPFAQSPVSTVAAFAVERGWPGAYQP